MERVEFLGIYRKNTKGRAYLIFDGAAGERRIVRASAKYGLQNGARVRAAGTVVGHRFFAEYVQEEVAPRRVPRRRRAA